jgi:hypothetical protein
MLGPLRRVRIHEPAVALTDLLLAIETAVCAVALLRGSPPSDAPKRSRDLHRWLIALYAASAAASLAGAAVHARDASRQDPRRLHLWRASLASIGVAGYSAWQVGASLALGRDVRRVLLAPVTALHVAYLVVVVRTRPPFRLALAIYGPDALSLCLALLSRLPEDRERRPAALALLAFTVSTAAAVMQVRGFALQPRWFDHNATFHTVQAVAFALLLPAAQGLVRASASAGALHRGAVTGRWPIASSGSRRSPSTSVARSSR